MIGIYKIINLKTSKYYIGSSKNISQREKYHFSRLKKNSHFNKHLQSSFNKYGIDNFKFEIIEEINIFNKEKLLELEQCYIDNEKESNLYNLTYITTGGGSDVLSIPVYLLNLSGEIINNFCSISEASRQLNYKTILKANTGAIIRKSYRLVTYKFYNENQNIISSWKNFSNMTRFIAERIKKKRMLLLEINNEIIEFKDRKELSKYLNVSKQYVEHVIKNGNFIKFKYPELNKIQNFKIKQ